LVVGVALSRWRDEKSGKKREREKGRAKKKKVFERGKVKREGGSRRASFFPSLDLLCSLLPFPLLSFHLILSSLLPSLPILSSSSPSTTTIWAQQPPPPAPGAPTAAEKQQQPLLILLLLLLPLLPRPAARGQRPSGSAGRQRSLAPRDASRCVREFLLMFHSEHRRSRERERERKSGTSESKRSKRKKKQTQAREREDEETHEQKKKL
jgi:hypothetical protein